MAEQKRYEVDSNQVLMWMIVAALDCERVRLFEFKMNETHPIDCHRHDRVIMALEDVIRHFSDACHQASKSTAKTQG